MSKKTWTIVVIGAVLAIGLGTCQALRAMRTKPVPTRTVYVCEKCGRVLELEEQSPEMDLLIAAREIRCPHCGGRKFQQVPAEQAKTKLTTNQRSEE